MLRRGITSPPLPSPSFHFPLATLLTLVFSSLIPSLICRGLGSISHSVVQGTGNVIIASKFVDKS